MCILYLLIICTYQGRATFAIGAILAVTVYISLEFFGLFRGTSKFTSQLRREPTWPFFQIGISLKAKHP